jgi:hypothetical protein
MVVKKIRFRTVTSFYLVSCLVALVLAAPTLFGQSTSQAVPRLVKFGSTVKNVQGRPMAGVVGITFALYKDQEGGAPLWLETQNVQIDKNGHYSVMLGFTTSAGLPVELFTSNEARWVGVQPQGQMEQPRVLLVSAPYALKAVDAETLGGKPASAFMPATPQIPGSSTAATSKSQGAASGTSSQNNAVIPSLSGSGTKGRIAMWDSSNKLGNSALFQIPTGTSGKVGINTTTPLNTLQVTAPDQLGLLVQGPVTGVGAGLDMQTTGTGGKGWEILATGKTAAQGQGKLNIRDLSTGADVFTITATGAIGVGAVNPGASLDVEDASHGNAVIGDEFATTGTTNGVLGQIFSSGNDSTAVLGLANASSGTTYGVRGINSSSTRNAAGVLGESFATSGVNFGLVGSTKSPNGTGAVALGGGESSTGFGLIGCCPVGVWGDTGSSIGGAAGLVGTADDARAIYLQNNSPSGVPTAYMSNAASGTLTVLQAGGSGGFCTIDTNGHLSCANALSVLAAVDSGQRHLALYAMESPQNWFEDFGSGQLASGTSRVTLDAAFADAVNTGVRYHVFLTPRDECEGLYVSNATASGFEVHELHRGRSNVAFDYRIVALRRGYENVRLEDMTERLKKTNVPMPKTTPGPRVAMPAPSPKLSAHVAPLKANVVPSVGPNAQP